MKTINCVDFLTNCSMSSPNWTSVKDFKCKNKEVVHKNINYKIISKETKKCSIPARIFWIVLNILTATILSRCSKRIERIANKGKENIYFALPSTYGQNNKINRILANGWQPKSFNDTVSQAKMWDNSLKAINEHAHIEGHAIYQKPLPAPTNSIFEKIGNVVRGACKTVTEMHFDYSPISRVSPNKEALPNIDAAAFNPSELPKVAQNLKVSNSSASAQGKPLTFENTHFSKELSEGTLSGVFAGHGGTEIAEYASNAFQSRFENELKSSNGNVKYSFEKLFHEIQTEIAHADHLKKIGSEAVITYIDKKTKIIYTATLGDCKANIYRKIDDQMKSIPLSCVRNWASDKDAARATKAKKDWNALQNWSSSDSSKKLFFPDSSHGINVSRAFGDLQAGYLMNGSGMTHKPKITMNALKPGDVVVLANSGLKDSMAEKAIISRVENYKKSYFGNLASTLVKDAIHFFDAKENVTVVTLDT